MILNQTTPQTASLNISGTATAAAVNATTLSVSQTALVAGAVDAKFEGFSYFTEGFSKLPGWAKVVANTLDFNTLGTSTYNTTTGAFTAPKAGYYRFGTHGSSPASSAGGTADRMNCAYTVNGTRKVVGGGQFSPTDSPLVAPSHILRLSVNDVVTVECFSPQVTAVQFGAVGTPWYFQGQYLGHD